MEYALIIIGGGASGLASAVTASSMGVQKIAVLERLPRVGKKILATGNGRCNLSHKHISSENYAGSYDTSHVLENFGSAENFFENLGLYCRTDEQGRIYPYSMTANAVLDALRMHCSQVTEFCNERAVQLYQKHKKWHIITEKGNHMIAERVIFSAGGTVAPKFGTDGSAWNMLEKLQIPLSESKPILCPLRSDSDVLQMLKGIRVKGSVTLYEKQHALRTETGEIQFTEQAISGICVFNLVGLISRKNFSDYVISVNLFPELEIAELAARLYSCQAVRYDTDCENMLSGLIQKAIARVILKKNQIQPVTPCCQLSGRQIQQIAECLHDFRFPVLGTVHAQAQASAGGVLGTALDENLQVKSCSGLYITGEAVDVHADCGGYQLHWAWASGYTAGTHCAEMQKRGN